MPEEHVVQTLARIIDCERLAGGQWKVKQELGGSGTGIRQTMWQHLPHGGHCSGVWRNTICVLALPNLPWILDPAARELVVNKLHSSVDPWLGVCINEIVQKKNISEVAAGSIWTESDNGQNETGS